LRSATLVSVRPLLLPYGSFPRAPALAYSDGAQGGTSDDSAHLQQCGRHGTRQPTFSSAEHCKDGDK